MKRLLITLTATILVAASLWAKDDEVIVTRQLTAAQRGALPEKTIDVEMKYLAFNKKAESGLVQAITLMIAMLNVVINLGIDLIYGLCDPRIRLD